jgi:hypothetical protein
MSQNIIPVIPLISLIPTVILYGLGVAALIYFIKALRIYIKKNS